LAPAPETKLAGVLPSIVHVNVHDPLPPEVDAE
jgi:hypothetical protein